MMGDGWKLKLLGGEGSGLGNGWVRNVGEKMGREMEEREEEWKREVV